MRGGCGGLGPRTPTRGLPSPPQGSPAPWAPYTSPAPTLISGCSLRPQGARGAVSPEPGTGQAASSPQDAGSHAATTWPLCTGSTSCRVLCWQTGTWPSRRSCWVESPGLTLSSSLARGEAICLWGWSQAGREQLSLGGERGAPIFSTQPAAACVSASA